VQEHRAVTRSERKEATRQAILDAALVLSADTGLGGLSLRSVARAVGIVPTAFYRHFASIEELGIALVDEAFASLRKVLRDLRRDMDIQRVIDDSVAILARNVRERRGHFMFIARERVGGSPAVREAIRQELGLFERELATDVARLPAMQQWTTEDLRVLANLIVGAMVETAEAIMTAPPGRPDIEREVVRTAELQLRMVVVGAANWRSSPDRG
jgi:AcrR family transcriptional regulator